MSILVKYYLSTGALRRHLSALLQRLRFAEHYSKLFLAESNHQCCYMVLAFEYEDEIPCSAAHNTAAT